MKMKTKTKTKTRITRKRKNHRRKTYKGGALESNKTYCNKKAPIKPFQDLYDQVDTTKYSRGFTTYSGAGCDLFIWVKNIQDPHIHVHGFIDNTFYYTISGLEVRNEPVKLPAPTKEGYKHVLDVMCSRLTLGKHVSTSRVFFSPERTLSMVEPPVTNGKPLPITFGLITDKFMGVSEKLGPRMAKEMKKEASVLREPSVQEEPSDQAEPSDQEEQEEPSVSERTI
jgi:hypothetical protein